MTYEVFCGEGCDVLLAHASARVFTAVSLMASVVLAVFIAQTKGVKFYDLQTSGAVRGEGVFLIRRPDNAYDVNCIDVQLARGRLLVGHLEAGVAAHLSPLMRDLPVDVSG